MDVCKLIIKQTYFIPKPENEIGVAVFDELNRDKPMDLGKLGVEFEWVLNSRHGNSSNYVLNLKYAYLTIKEVFSYSDYKEKAKMLISEFKKLTSVEAFKFVLNNYDNVQPFEVNVDVISSEENGYKIDVECIPIIYFNHTKFGKVEFDDFVIQDAKLVSERFLKTIFAGGLNGTLMSEKEHWKPRESATELLINDVGIHQVAQKIEEVLENATGEVLIMAWIGTILLTTLRSLKEKGVRIKVITGNVKEIRQDSMQKEKQKAFQELILILGLDNICNKSDFHGRIIIVDNKAFVGSMDLDSYSLTGTRTEFAIYTENVDVVRTLRAYFNKIFEPLKTNAKEENN
jgi:HKD family nuclease